MKSVLRSEEGNLMCDFFPLEFKLLDRTSAVARDPDLLNEW